MTDEQRSKCHAIIHSSAAACGGGNLIPVPGLGVAADVAAMTAMTMSLAGVFGGSISEGVAKNMAVVALKRTMLKQPIKTIGKELGKFIPFFGQIFAATVSAGMIEAAGWSLAEELAAKANSWNN